MKIKCETPKELQLIGKPITYKNKKVGVIESVDGNTFVASITTKNKQFKKALADTNVRIGVSICG